MSVFCFDVVEVLFDVWFDKGLSVLVFGFFLILDYFGVFKVFEFFDQRDCWEWIELFDLYQVDIVDVVCVVFFKQVVVDFI